jgi:hypothetical protein
MLRPTRAALALAALAAPFAAACNDGIKCQTGALVLITSPTGDVVADSDPTTAGLQTDVHVRTTLGQGMPLSLTITDATGAPAGTATTTAAADGTAVFTAVTLPYGMTTLTATALDDCGDDTNSAVIDVVSGTSCALSISPTPATNAFYAPVGVLTAAADPDPATPGFQANVMVATQGGWRAELFVTDPSGAETSAGMMPAPTGSAAYPLALAEGRTSVRAVCTDPVTGATASTLATPVFVDTTPPTCAVAEPAPGTTITPALDADGDLSNGVQLTLGGVIGGGDVTGEPATFTVIAPDGTHNDLTGSTINAVGVSTVPATIAPATTPATYSIELRASDHAGNPCTPAHDDYSVVYNGCGITVDTPTGAVTADVDHNPANGAQLDATITVDAACAGQTVTTDCGVGTTTATVPAAGDLTMRLTACNSDPCMLTEACTFKVTSTAGVQTSAGLSLVFDDQAPTVALSIVNPSLACGAQVGPGDDVDPAMNGVQVVAHVASTGATTQQVKVTNTSGTTTLDATNDVEVTLASGANTLVGLASDMYGNTGTTPGCALTLSDLAVSFLPPAADGMLAATDGTVSGNNLTTNICGTVNKTGATVTLALDGGAPQPATVTGTQWCRQETLAVSPPSHTLVASATAGTSFGSATLVVSVDLTAPGGVTDLAATSPNRRTIDATWTAPSDGGAAVDHYIVKLSTTALSNGNFDTTGSALAVGAPKAPGSPESLTIPVRAGTPYWLGVASADAAGNRAAADIVGPITPQFDQTAAITPPDAATAGDVQLGWSFAHGKFNDDGYEDVAVGAATRTDGPYKTAGAVYVYFGGPNGLPATPSVIIQTSEVNDEMGAGLTAVRWSSATRDDLVIGAPFANGSRGRLYIFHGGATFPIASTVDAGTADQIIGVNATNPGWFSGGALGWSLTAADFDGDGVQDLAAGAIFGGGTQGGVVVIFGGTASAANIALSDVDASGLAGVEAQIISNPSGVNGRWWGHNVFNVGRTTGASDTTDDLLIAQLDDTGTAGDSAWIYRGAAPRTPGVSFRSFTTGTDVRVDYVTADKTTEWGLSAAGVSDVDGDGARDVAIGAWQNGSNDGQVVIISGPTVGTAGVARTGDPGVVLTTINGLSASKFGVAIASQAGTSGDVDGDGKDDLLVAGFFGGAARLYVWYGGSIPIGTTTTATASDVLTGPATFLFSQSNQTPPAMVSWVGDVNGDGLDDLCWSSPFDNSKDGSFQLLWDDGM